MSDDKKSKKAAYDKAYYSRMKEVRYSYQKEWREKNKEKFLRTIRERYLIPEGRIRKLVNSIRSRCKSKNLDCDITAEWVLKKWEDTEGCCERTGIPFVLRSKGNAECFSPSIDRVDPKKGYTVDNCQLVIWMYNAAKGQGTDDDVKYFCKKVLEKSDE